MLSRINKSALLLISNPKIYKKDLTKLGYLLFGLDFG